MSSLTHCSHVFLLRPRPLVPSTTNPLQADTQSSTLLRSRLSKPSQSSTPHHISNTMEYSRRLYKSSLRFLSFKDTPHIHLTIIRSVLSRLLRSSAFIAHVHIPEIMKNSLPMHSGWENIIIECIFVWNNRFWRCSATFWLKKAPSISISSSKYILHWALVPHCAVLVYSGY